MLEYVTSWFIIMDIWWISVGWDFFVLLAEQDS